MQKWWRFWQSHVDTMHCCPSSLPVVFYSVEEVEVGIHAHGNSSVWAHECKLYSFPSRLALGSPIWTGKCRSVKYVSLGVSLCLYMVELPLKEVLCVLHHTMTTTPTCRISSLCCWRCLTPRSRRSRSIVPRDADSGIWDRRKQLRNLGRETSFFSWMRRHSLQNVIRFFRIFFFHAGIEQFHEIMLLSASCEHSRIDLGSSRCSIPTITSKKMSCKSALPCSRFVHHRFIRWQPRPLVEFVPLLLKVSHSSLSQIEI